ncbi:GNAT family N-acetyltransferase [Jannaschia pohangensis]|uniref:Acetyltransferase (GNAT) family protein n=1 Tax=Jannaschia pohangensis TaxID=390807 RepID=A0A1I3HQG0_9RHOB|nr:GNAT family N-acetyltransferase [Jannaschia pohangensis]SFI37770.1 Acetyltransferase (GNAT) family protein [Jannaschia pohangensis]
MDHDISYRPVRAARILAFRQAMLWPDRPIAHVEVPGDDTALHLGAFAGHALVGAGSFFAHGAATQLRKLAVDPGWRGHGIGSELVRQGAAMTRAEGQHSLWCDARAESCAFYVAIGFEIDPDTYQKSGRPYRRATLRLT